ncbi:MAG TPA: hypothetical protein EYG52_16435 [Pseudomonadales bacterium]|nr:hypothetical protein [Gammaproteobacteria bacterium]HIL85086.1 hypothetical protein [Pseudomonadales bacterium]
MIRRDILSDLDLLTNRLAIEDLFARYAHTADTYDADGWVDYFAEDGTFEVEVDGGVIQVQSAKHHC